MYLEEAAYLDPAMYYEVVVPLLLIEYTSIIGISTPRSEFDFYTKQFDILDENDEPLFYTIRVGQSCQDCLNRHVKCVHRVMRLPDWQPAKNRDKVSRIQASDPDLFAREAGGDIVGSSQYPFDRRWISQLESSDAYDFKHQVQVLHLGIDPSGGGKSSDFALMTLAFESPYYVVSHINAKCTHAVQTTMPMDRSLAGV